MDIIKKKTEISDNEYRPNIWIMSMGEGSYMWETFFMDGIAAIDWHNVDTGDLSRYKTKEDMSILGLQMNATLCLWQFSKEIKSGDIVLVKKGLYQLLGVGVVEAPYFYVESDEYFSIGDYPRHYGNYRHRIKVRWLKNESVKTNRVLPRKTLTCIKGEENIEYYMSLFDILLPDNNYHINNNRRGKVGSDYHMDFSIPKSDDKDILSDEEKQEIIGEIEEGTEDLKGCERDVLIKGRVNQGVFRKRLLERYEKCCLCNVNDRRFLIASHIIPWSEAEDEEKLDPDNGLLLCPNHDRAFDGKYITFDDDGLIIISDELSGENRESLNIHEGMSIKMRDGNRKYIKYHREKLFNGNKSDT